MAVTSETIRAELEEGLLDESIQRRAIETLVRQANITSQLVETYLHHLLRYDGYSLSFSTEDWDKIVERCYWECSLQLCRSPQQRHKNLIFNDLYGATASDRYSSLGLFKNSQRVDLNDLIPLTSTEQRRCAEHLLSDLLPREDEQREEVLSEYLLSAQEDGDLIYLSSDIADVMPREADAARMIFLDILCSISEK